MSLSSDEKKLVKQRVISGFDRLEPYLDKTPAIEIEEKPLILKDMDPGSLVWVNDKFERIIQRICVQVKNIQDLKRIVVYTLDPESLARVINQKKYWFVFQNPNLRIILMKPEENLEFKDAVEYFAYDAWDSKGRSMILSNFEDKDSDVAQKWNRQILGVHDVILHVANRGAGDPANTADVFIGFRNSLKNIFTSLKSPDVRQLKSLFKSKPAFIVGAGPSVEPQLDWLKKHEGDGIIIAADTMLAPLREAGIRPDIICSLERTPGVKDLLDKGHSHPQTLLLASNVLDPECFEIYDGPYSIYYPYNTWQNWIPITRSQFATGHSCIGLAMGMASFLECDPMILMGIDLCWTPEGQSHMGKVPYLDKDYYKKINQFARDNSFFSENAQGKQVETNLYWTLFRKQFAQWAERIPSTVYNLSPFGLPLTGEVRTTPEQLDQEMRFPENKMNYFEELTKQMPYEATRFRRDSLTVILELFKEQLEDLKIVHRDSQDLRGSELKETLEACSVYESLIMPIMGGTVFTLDSELEKEQELSEKSVKKHLDKLLQFYENELVPDFEKQLKSYDEAPYPLF